ncbi:MAG: 6-phosphofructokinase, partial [Desulfobacterales bacterium]
MESNTMMSSGSILPPDIREIIDCIHPDLAARRREIPQKCAVFSSKYTILEDDAHHRFHMDSAARKQLPRIINNRLQRILGTDALEPALEEGFHRKRRIGIVFSGGPAPGGHNVIAGLYDTAKAANPQTKVFGFLLGPDGVIENEAIELTDELIDAHRNLGGFSMIKTGRAKIDTPEKMALSRETCKTLGLDALVIVGGDDSNTNAAFLAEALFDDGIQVIGVPKTIDGDIQVRDADNALLCAISFGFHSAARGFAKSISQLCTDASSDVKYWHVCKVMGRVASHLALEVALQTHANLTLIGEDLADYVDGDRLDKARETGTTDYTAYGMTLRHLSRVICDGIVRRAASGKNFGIIVIPEGLLEFINEIQVFIIKLNAIIAEYNDTHDEDFHSTLPILDEKLDYLRRLARRSREDGIFSLWNTRDDDLFNDIPGFFQEGLLTERDSHGNFQFSLVETEKVLMDLVRDHLEVLKEKGTYKVGIEREYYRKTMEGNGLAPDRYGSSLFGDYSDGAFLIVRPDIISLKTLKQILVKDSLMSEADQIPDVVETIYTQSIPRFRAQTHFYGYDGRGSDPTRFDCTYAYNLGLTAFSLIV